MDQKTYYMCTTHAELQSLIPLITECYNNGCFVYFLNLNHQEGTCTYIEENYIVIFIDAQLKQAARAIINLYNEHFRLTDEDGDEIDPQRAFTCPICNILTL